MRDGGGRIGRSFGFPAPLMRENNSSIPIS